MHDKSPHNSRIFSAHVGMLATNFGIWALLVVLFGVNMMAPPRGHMAYGNNLSRVFARPFAWETHMTLAQTLWSNNATDEAKGELQLAQELFAAHNDSVLGVSTTPLNLLATWKQDPAQKEHERQFWKNIMALHPDYRDGYIQLAFIAYSEGNLQDAKAYAHKAHALDPNGEIVQKIEDFISKNSNEVTK